jgi:hypothetical protein
MIYQLFSFLMTVYNINSAFKIKILTKLIQNLTKLTRITHIAALEICNIFNKNIIVRIDLELVL